MLKRIPIDAIEPNPDQPRKQFDPEALTDLADSILSVGLLQPITVRPLGSGRYMIVAGERRWRAHKFLADDGRIESFTILAHVRCMDDARMKLEAIVENLQRADITPLEETDAFLSLVTAGMTVDEIATKLGLAPFRVRWRLQLANLAPDIRQLFATGNIDRQQALEIARLEDHAAQHRVLRLVRSGKVVGWKVVRSVVDSIIQAADQSDMFGGEPTEEHIAAVRSLENRIGSIAAVVAKGWKDGECIIASKVDPTRAGYVADQIAAVAKALRVMERELRNTLGQVSLLADAA